MKVFRAGEQVNVPGIVLLEEVSATLSYIGSALPGTPETVEGWTVQRLDTSARLELKTANGGLPTTWSGRDSHTYS